MNFAILRTKKLKSFGSIARSARHTFRDQLTPNANPDHTKRNRTVGAVTPLQVVESIRRQLPDARRKDSVLCIEYLITASPEAFKRHGGHLDDLGSGYFNRALSWLRERHGASNVISATVHLDETTPHLVAYVVPRTEDGRLSCRDFLGGPAKMRDMQNSFYAVCAKQHGLERGLQGSKAKHENISKFYAIMAAEGKAPMLKPRDYAAAAIGIKTKAWSKAEDLALANATSATLRRRTRKATRSKARAANSLAESLAQRREALGHEEVLLRHERDVVEQRSSSIRAREIELIAAENEVLGLEAERDALQRRLEMIENRSISYSRPPERGRESDADLSPPW